MANKLKVCSIVPLSILVVCKVEHGSEKDMDISSPHLDSQLDSGKLFNEASPSILEDGILSKKFLVVGTEVEVSVIRVNLTSQSLSGSTKNVTLELPSKPSSHLDKAIASTPPLLEHVPSSEKPKMLASHPVS